MFPRISPAIYVDNSVLRVTGTLRELPSIGNATQWLVNFLEQVLKLKVFNDAPGKRGESATIATSQAAAQAVGEKMRALGIPQEKQVKWLGVGYVLESQQDQQDQARISRLKASRQRWSKIA